MSVPGGAWRVTVLRQLPNKSARLWLGMMIARLGSILLLLAAHDALKAPPGGRAAAPAHIRRDGVQMFKDVGGGPIAATAGAIVPQPGLPLHQLGQHPHLPPR